MKTSKNLFLLSFLGFCGVASAQESLITDRPDFTESPQTVPNGRFQIEGGVTFERAGSSKTTTLGETLVRVAAGDKTEIRLGVPSYVLARDGQRTSGFDDGSLGVKFALAPGEGIGFKRPALGLILSTSAPLGSQRIAARKWVPEAKLAASVDLNDKWSFATNIGVARPSEGGDRFTQLIGTGSFAVGLSERVGAYFEGFVFSKTTPDGDSARYLNTGLTYLVNPDFQLDARVGFGVNNDVNGPDYFLGVGAARRF